MKSLIRLFIYSIGLAAWIAIIEETGRYWPLFCILLTIPGLIMTYIDSIKFISKILKNNYV
jgi:hypothetical protein